jgi:flavin-dependent dehydrogenase
VSGERLSVDVLVIGGGPAGSTLAARLAQLGHEVALLERSAFPRPRLGESLTPGVLPLLRCTGADAPVEAAGFQRVERVLVEWDGATRERDDEGARGLLVDRGRFDRLLLEHARSLGVRVLQPAVLTERGHNAGRWRVRAGRNGRSVQIEASLLADAAGRSRGLPARREPTGSRTLCLYAYWRGFRSPVLPRIQALGDAWCWRVPLPGGPVNLLFFIDPERLRGRPRRTDTCYHELVRGSALVLDQPAAQLAGRVLAAEATPYLDRDCVTPTTIKVGDAGLSLDPISSSGVQRAVQTALAGAVVVNTLLRRPSAADAACRFFRDSLTRASDRHRAWAAEHYARAAASHSGDFWARRSAPAATAPRRTNAPPRRNGPTLDLESRFQMSPQTVLVDVPCAAGEFVEVRAAVSHPALDDAVAYLGGWELAPLLRRAVRGLTGRELVDSWSALVPRDAALAIGSWLARNDILVPLGERA